MQPFEKNKIPNKYHPCTTEDIPVANTSTDAMQAKDKKIAKYALRVLISYILPPMTAQADSALKRVKKIGKIQEDLPKYQPKYHKNPWRSLLQNKFKSILIYDSRENGREPFKKYKAFSKVTQVLLQDRNPNKSIMRYLPGMINLKYLDFLIKSERPSNLLKKLNSMPRTLSRLETLKIECSAVEKKEEEENNILFHCLAENKDILKNLTHLSIVGIQEDFFLEHISKDCRNLVFLSANFSKTSQKEHCSYLRNFEKLEGIQIFSENFELFIKNFTLPSSIKHVCVNFGAGVDWDEIPEELISSTENNFYEKWRGRTNLVTLRISAKLGHYERFHVKDFMELILQSVPNLINLELEVQLPKGNEYYVDSENPINLTQMFLACQNYSDRLEEIKLTLPTQYPVTCPSVEGIHFPKLKLLQLQKSRILNTETLENLFKVIKNSLANENIVRILLGNFLVKENDTLVPLLEVLKKSPRNSKIALKIEVKKKILDKLMLADLIENMKKVPALQNVPSEIDISRYQDYKSERWKVTHFLKEMFAIAQFSEKYELEFEPRDNYDSDQNAEI